MLRSATKFLSVFLLVSVSAHSVYAFNSKSYSSLYPLSIKYCAVSQVHRDGKDAGNSFGHAVLFLDDVCLDSSSHYPKLRRCNSADAVKGTGVSVNKTFSNINWVGTPGSELFFYGDKSPNDKVDVDAKNDLIKKIVGMGLYKGVQFRSEFMDKKPADVDALEYGINNSLDTDFAVNWGRDLYCVNIPVSSQMLDHAVKYANLINARYADENDFSQISASLTAQEKQNFEFKNSSSVNGYRFNGLTNNCTHLAYNVIAATGIVPKKKIGSIPGKNLAIPSDVLVSLYDHANGVLPAHIADLNQAFTNPSSYALLVNENWFFPHDGSVIDVISMHEKNNTLFQHTDSLSSLGAKGRFAAITKNLADRDLQANVSRFATAYQSSAQQIKQDLQAQKTAPTGEFASFVSRYLNYIEQRSEQIRSESSH